MLSWERPWQPIAQTVPTAACLQSTWKHSFFPLLSILNVGFVAFLFSSPPPPSTKISHNELPRKKTLALFSPSWNYPNDSHRSRFGMPHRPVPRSISGCAVPPPGGTESCTGQPRIHPPTHRQNRTAMQIESTLLAEKREAKQSRTHVFENRCLMIRFQTLSCFNCN